MELLEGMENATDATALISPEAEDAGSLGAKEKASGVDNADWRSGLDDVLKADQSLARFKDVGSLAKSYTELRKSIGKSEIPNEKSTAEDIQEFYRKSGIPDKEKYAIDEKKYGLSSEMAKSLKEIASTSGVTEHGLAKVFDTIQAADLKQREDYDAEMKAVFTEQVDGLKKEYGTAFNKYLNLGNEIAKEIFTVEEMNMLKEQKISNNPLFAKALMKVAQERFGEGLIDDNHTKQGFVATPEAVQNRIAEILEDKDFQNSKSARYKSLFQEFDKLHILKANQK